MTMLLLALMWLAPMAPARAEAAPRAETCATCHRRMERTDGNGNLDATKSRMDLAATAINRAVPDVFASTTDFFGGFDARALEGPVLFTGGRASLAGFATIVDFGNCAELLGAGLTYDLSLSSDGLLLARTADSSCGRSSSTIFGSGTTVLGPNQWYRLTIRAKSGRWMAGGEARLLYVEGVLEVEVFTQTQDSDYLNPDGDGWNNTTTCLRFLSTSQGAAYVHTINVYTGAFVP